MKCSITPTGTHTYSFLTYKEPEKPHFRPRLWINSVKPRKRESKPSRFPTLWFFFLSLRVLYKGEGSISNPSHKTKQLIKTQHHGCQWLVGFGCLGLLCPSPAGSSSASTSVRLESRFFWPKQRSCSSTRGWYLRIFGDCTWLQMPGARSNSQLFHIYIYIV